jgi:3-oxoacyl-[acyl-carrier protein] reductase
MTEGALRRGEDLAGKVALVTGGARNLGRAISRSLAAGGSSVAVNFNTSREMAEESLAAIKADGGDAVLIQADVTQPAQVEALVRETVERFGRIDILVNNAAVRAETRFESISLEEWRGVMAICLDAAFLCTQAGLPYLKESGAGTVINLGGMTGHLGAVERAHVVAAKAGLAGLTKALALEFAEHGITVNCVVPGMIDTQRGLPGAPLRPPGTSSIPPVGRRGHVNEVAGMVRHLCGPDGRYITGQTIHVNGGAYLP